MFIYVLVGVFSSGMRGLVFSSWIWVCVCVHSWMCVGVFMDMDVGCPLLSAAFFAVIAGFVNRVAHVVVVDGGDRAHADHYVGHTNNHT